MATGTWYHLKTSFAIFPGRLNAICPEVLNEHDATLQAERSWHRLLLDMFVGTIFRLWIRPRARQIQKRYELNRHWRARAVRVARARFVDPNEIALMAFDTEAAMATLNRRFEFPALSKVFNPTGGHGVQLIELEPGEEVAIRLEKWPPFRASF